MKRLDNKVAIVTGASKGIGAAIAKSFGAEGAAVIVNYARDQAGAERVVREITGKGGRAIAVQCDVAQRSDAQRLVAEAKKAFGRLDVLVNNAGVFSFAPFEQFSEQEFRFMASPHALHGDGSPAFAGDFAHHPFRAFMIARIVHNHRRAFRAESSCNARSDSF